MVGSRNKSGGARGATRGNASPPIHRNKQMCPLGLFESHLKQGAEEVGVHQVPPAIHLHRIPQLQRCLQLLLAGLQYFGSGNQQNMQRRIIAKVAK